MQKMVITKFFLYNMLMLNNIFVVFYGRLLYSRVLKLLQEARLQWPCRRYCVQDIIIIIYSMSELMYEVVFIFDLIIFKLSASILCC